jgi:diacylglycerol kinase
VDELYVRTRRSWVKKLSSAMVGCLIGTRGHNSFAIHIPAAALVLAAGGYFRVTASEWCVLVFCIAAVFAAELFNSSIETLARAVTPYKSEHVSQSLDIASGAVFVTAIGAAIVGMIVFVPKLLTLWR